MKASSATKTCVRNFRDGDQIIRCKQLLAVSSTELTNAAKTFSVCSSPVRLFILRLLELERELCVCDLAEVLEISVPGVSQQLRKLKEVGAITSRRVGNTIYHTTVPEFQQRLAQTANLLTEMKTI